MMPLKRFLSVCLLLCLFDVQVASAQSEPSDILREDIQAAAELVASKYKPIHWPYLARPQRTTPTSSDISSDSPAIERDYADMQDLQELSHLRVRDRHYAKNKTAYQPIFYHASNLQIPVNWRIQNTTVIDSTIDDTDSLIRFQIIGTNLNGWIQEIEVATSTQVETFQPEVLLAQLGGNSRIIETRFITTSQGIQGVQHIFHTTIAGQQGTGMLYLLTTAQKLYAVGILGP
ncbi:MAG: hypothetical protein AAF639_42070, partial [Chloroflexota bacterium]